jgi:CubicO group peptidase (beta-lactamase class C family)
MAPEIEPSAVGMDPEVLDEMVAILEQATAGGELFRGAQLAVYREGRRVLDAGVGLARERTRVPVTPDTLFVLFSATKGLTALAMLMLYERGAFHYDEPVVKYWPEFAHGVPEKRSVTIRHVMSHRGGFPIGPAWLTTRFFGDREALRRAMEEVPLRFVPGERNMYHPMNFGHVLNELIERIDGRDCGRFLHEEVFEPLGLRDLYLGLPDDAALEERVAWTYTDLQAAEAGRAAGFAGGTVQSTETDSERAAREARLRDRFGETPELANGFNRPQTHRAVLPAAGAIGTARALADVYAVLSLGGERDGIRLVTPHGLDCVTTPTNRPDERDGLIGEVMRWGTGFHMGTYGRGSSLRTFGHAGAGGQIGFADRQHRLAFAFVTNGEKSARFFPWRYKLQSMAFDACAD